MSMAIERDLVYLRQKSKKKPGEFCEIWQKPKDDLDVVGRRERIISFMLDRKRNPYAFSRPDFPKEELNHAHVCMIIILISHFFYKNDSLISFIRDVLPSSFTAGVVEAIPDSHGCSAVCELFPDHTKDGFRFGQILLDRRYWDEKANNRIADGIPSRGNKVRCLVITICHEIMHLIAGTQCGNTSHDKHFRNMTSSNFGHDSNAPARSFSY